MVRFAILGAVEARDGEQEMPLGGRRQVALLAFLLVHANRAVSTDQLIEALWPGQNAAGAPKRAQVAVGRLRRAIDRRGEHKSLRTVSGGYSLQLAAGQLDAEVSKRWCATGCARWTRASRRTPPSTCVRRSRCGAGRPWRTSPTTSSPSLRCAAWRSCAPPPARRAWRPTCA